MCSSCFRFFSWLVVFFQSQTEVQKEMLVCFSAVVSLIFAIYLFEDKNGQEVYNRKCVLRSGLGLEGETEKDLLTGRENVREDGVVVC